jgi:hypothetical protein
MTDFSIRSDNVDVEQIMRQIRSRIREKRGVDYTEEEIRELANVKLEKFLDPRGVRSDLLEQFRRKREASLPPNFKFEDTTLYETHRGFLAFMRKLLNPILKLFFNPNPLIEALNIQSKLNAQQAALEPLYYEVIHNLVLETTRLGIDVKNLKMRVESMSSRLDFDERRARALEGVVQYRPGAVPPLQPPTGGERREPRTEADQAERRNRRRRRRGRRRPDDRGGAPSSEGLPRASGETSESRGLPRASADSSESRGLPRASADSSESRGLPRASADSSESRGATGESATRAEGGERWEDRGSRQDASRDYTPVSNSDRGDSSGGDSNEFDSNGGDRSES